MAGENVMLSSSWDDRKYTDRSGENLNRYGIWNRGSGPRRGGRQPPGPVFQFVIGIAMLVYAGISIGPAVSAARGHGVQGYYVAQAEHCSHTRSHGGSTNCWWIGLFRLPDGQVTRRGMEFFGSEYGMHAGSAVPALDTGALNAVYPRHGDKSWLAVLAMGTIGTALIGYRIWTWTRRSRHGSLGGPIQSWIGP